MEIRIVRWMKRRNDNKEERLSLDEKFRTRNDGSEKNEKI